MTLTDKSYSSDVYIRLFAKTLGRMQSSAEDLLESSRCVTKVWVNAFFLKDAHRGLRPFVQRPVQRPYSRLRLVMRLCSIPNPMWWVQEEGLILTCVSALVSLTGQSSYSLVGLQMKSS